MLRLDSGLQQNSRIAHDLIVVSTTQHAASTDVLESLSAVLSLMLTTHQKTEERCSRKMVRTAYTVF